MVIRLYDIEGDIERQDTDRKPRGRDRKKRHQMKIKKQRQYSKRKSLEGDIDREDSDIEREMYKRE